MTFHRLKLVQRIATGLNLLLSILISPYHAVLAETLSLIRDVNTCGEVTPLGQVARLTRGTVTTASFIGYGLELGVVSDGRPTLVRDLSPGEDGSSIDFLFVFRDQVYFDLLTAAGDRSVWRSDGTSAGTELVFDYDTGALSKQQIKFAQELDQFFVIQTTNVANQAETIFWVGDGQRVEGRAAIDNTPGHSLTSASVVGVTRDAVIIRGESAEFGAEPYMLRAAGKLTFINDLIPGASGSNPLDAVELDAGRIVLLAASASTGTALYLLNLSGVAESLLIDELKTSSGTSRFAPGAVAIGDHLFFALTGGDLAGLWVTNGTTNNSHRVPLPDWLSSSTSFALLGSYRERLLFCDRSGEFGCEPIITDGTAAGTSLLKDIYPGGAPSSASSFIPYAAQSQLLFSAMEPSSGYELYRTDGTPGGTLLLSDLRRGPASSSPRDFYLSSGGEVEFVADTVTGSTLMSLDPTSLEITPKALLAAGVSASSSPRNMVSLVNGDLIFSAVTCERGRDYLVLRSRSGQVDSIFAQDVPIIQDRVELLATIGGTAFFSLSTPENGTELWAFKGEARSAHLLKDLLPGPEGSFPANGGVVSGRYVFGALKEDGARQLWSSDGTPDETKILREDVVGLQGISTGVALPSDPSTMYFLATFRTASRSAYRLELWATGGTAATTRLISVVGDPYSDSQPKAPVVVGNRMVFNGYTNTAGVELWGSDGTAVGTTLLADLVPGREGSGALLNYTVFKGRVYFLGSGGKFIESDGTAPGTKFSSLFSTVLAGMTGAVMQSNSNVLFARLFYGATARLYVTDGAAVTTLNELAPVVTLAQPGTSNLIDQDLYFEAINPDGYRQLWKSNGTAGGTRMVANSTKRSPIAFNALHTFAKGIVVNAASPTFGNELFLLSNEAEPIPPDFCPTDPQKQFPGVCGCGSLDNDSDGDGWMDCQDQCPANRFLATAEKSPCACEIERKDADANGVADCLVLEETRFYLQKLLTSVKALRIRVKPRPKQDKALLKAIKSTPTRLKSLQTAGAAFYPVMTSTAYGSELTKLSTITKQLASAVKRKDATSMKKLKKRCVKSIQGLLSQLLK